MPPQSPRPFLVIAKEIDETTVKLDRLKVELLAALSHIGMGWDWKGAAKGILAAEPEPEPAPRRKRKFKHTAESKQKLRDAWSRRKEKKAQEAQNHTRLVELADRLPS